MGHVDALDSAVGALVGLAVGDAVGTTLEFKLRGTFEPISDLVGGGPFGLVPGEWTDDTSMALCLAESILDTGAIDPADQLRRYLLWRDEGYLSSNGHCFDIGGTTRDALERFRRTGEVTDPEVDAERAANGSLMRLAAVPVRWHDDLEICAANAAASSRTTHPAPRPVDACRLAAVMIGSLIAGEGFTEVTSPSFWRFGDLHPQIAAIAAGGWSEKEPHEIRGTGYCVDALEAALWAVAGAADFRGAALRAANLGDDADTTAAIAGQIAGARWGLDAIPQEWLAKLARAERIRSLARNLFAAAGGVLPAPWASEELIHAWWVDPRALLAGEYPGHTDPLVAREKVDVLVDAGIRTFVDLTTPDDGLAPYDDHVEAAAAARQLDLRRVPCPIPDLGVVDDAHLDEILASIGEARTVGGVYVHCWGGVGRTATVIGCVLAEQGLTYDQILIRLAELRAGTGKAGRPAPESAVQLDTLRQRSGGAP